MRKLISQIVLNDFGEYLGTCGQKFAVFKNGKITRKFDSHQIKEVYLKSGNTVSTQALTWCALYNINVLVLSNTEKLLASIQPLDGDARVKTRLAQYQAYNTEKGVKIAKAVVEARIQTQVNLLDEYGFKIRDLIPRLRRIKSQNIEDVRPEIQGIEGRVSRWYFKKYFLLFPRIFRPKIRENQNANGALNNLLNLSYEILKGEIYKAVINAHLDPYLGYLHSIEFGKPSLICDLQEIFRILAEKFLIKNKEKYLNVDNFYSKNEKRIFLKPRISKEFILNFNKSLEKKMPFKRRKFREKCTIKLAMYLHAQKNNYLPFSHIMPRFSFFVFAGSEVSRANKWFRPLFPTIAVRVNH